MVTNTEVIIYVTKPTTELKALHISIFSVEHISHMLYALLDWVKPVIQFGPAKRTKRAFQFDQQYPIGLLQL